MTRNRIGDWVRLSSLSSLVKSRGSVTVLASAILAPLTLLTGAITARLLTVPERGDYASILAFCAVLYFIAVAGVSDALVLCESRGLNRSEVLNLSLSYSVALSVIAAVPGYIYLQQLQVDDAKVVWLALITPLAGALTVISGSVLVSAGHAQRAAAIRVCPIMVQLLCLIGVYLSGKTSLPWILLTAVAGLWSSAIVGMWLVKPWNAVLKSPTAHTLKQFGSLSASMGGSQIVRALSSKADMIVVSLVLTNQQAGIYSVALAPTIAGVALVNSLAPLILSSKSDRSSRLTSVGSVISLAVGLMTAIIAPMLIPVVYGEAYSSASRLILVLVVAMVLNNIFDLLLRIFQQEGMERMSALASCSALFGQVIMTVVLGRLLGLYGVAVGSILGFSVGILFLSSAGRSIGGTPLAERLSPIQGLKSLKTALLH